MSVFIRSILSSRTFDTAIPRLAGKGVEVW
jgi:hypothetical protein